MSHSIASTIIWQQIRSTIAQGACTATIWSGYWKSTRTFILYKAHMLKSIFRITVKIRLYALYYHFKIDIRGRNRSRSIFSLIVKFCMRGDVADRHWLLFWMGRTRSSYWTGCALVLHGRLEFDLVGEIVLSHASANCLSFLLSLFWILNLLHRVQLLFAFLMNDGVIKHTIRNHQAIAFGYCSDWWDRTGQLSLPQLWIDYHYRKLYGCRVLLTENESVLSMS